MNEFKIEKALEESFKKAEKTALKVQEIRKSIKHPHFTYAVYDPETDTVTYKRKKFWQWFSGKREVHVKVMKFEYESIGSGYEKEIKIYKINL